MHTKQKGHSTKTMPLHMAQPGDMVELVEVRGGHRLRKRLADLGLNVGISVRVVQGGCNCPMILAVREDTRLALGHGMIRKIFVIPTITT
jgi:ferrous iron transport protein A